MAFGGVIKLQGENEYRAALKQIQNSLTLVGSEMQKVSSQFAKGEKSVHSLTSVNEVLNKKLVEQKKAVSEASKMLSQAQTKYSESSKSVQQWEQKLAAAKRALEEAKNSTTASAEEISKLENNVNECEQELESANTENERYATTVQRWQTEVNRAEAAVNRTTREIESNEAAIQQLESATEDTSGATETLTEKVKRQESELEELKRQYTNVAAEQGQSSDEARSLATQIENLSGELRDNRNNLNEASNAADSFDQSLEEVDDEANNTTNGGLSAFGVALGNLASEIISNLISKMKDMVAETIEVGKTFDSSMSQVAAVSGATADELDQLRNKAKEMGSTTKFTASEAADAFNYMSMAGWKTEDMLSGIDGVLNLAAASGSDLATTSDIVTDALTAMGYSAGDAGRLADVMAAASSNANTNVEMMGQTFQYAAPIVGALGYNMEDTAVAIGLMANAGIKADKAGTALRSVLTRLSAPPKECATEMEKLGLSMTDSEGKMKSLDQIMNDLRKAFSNLSETEQTAAAKHLAGAEAMSGLLAIVNAAPEDYNKLTDAVANAGFSIDDINKSLEDSGIQWENYSDKVWLANGGIEGLADEIIYNVDKIGTSTEELQKYLETEYDMNADDAAKAIEAVTTAMENSQGAAERMAETMLDNLGGDMTLLSSKLEGVQLAIYEKFEPALRKGVEVLDKLLDVVQFVVDHSTEFIAALTGMATAIGAYIAYTTALKVMENGWKSLTIVTKAQAAAQAALNAVMSLNPIGLVIAAIAGLVAAFVVLWNKSEKFRNFWINLWEKIKAAAEPIIEGIVTNFTAAWDKIKAAWSAVSGFFKGIWNAVKNVYSNTKNFFKDQFEGAWNGIKAVWGAVSGFFKGIYDNIKNAFSSVGSFFKDKFQAAANNTKSAFSTIGDFFKGVWDNIKNVFSKAWKNIANVVQVGLKLIVELIKGYFSLITLPFRFIWENCGESITKTWKEILATVGKAINSVKEVVVKISADIASRISEIWNSITTAIKTIMAAIYNIISTVWDNIKAVTTKVFTALYSVISKTINTIKNITVSIFTAIMTAISKIMAAIYKIISTIWDNIKSVITTVINAIKNVITTVFTAVQSTVNTIWNGIKNIISNTINAAKDTVTNVVNAIKNVVSTVFSAVQSTVSNIWNGIKSVITNTITAARDTVSNVVGNIKDKVSSTFEGIKNTASSVWESIKNAIKNAIETARDTVKNAIDRMKSFFNFSWSLPKLKLPHISISGEFSIDPPSVPHFSVDWYAKAMKNPMLLDSPTIFGMQGGKLLGAGEAGPEVVSGASKLMSMIRDAVITANEQTRYTDITAARSIEAPRTLDDSSQYTGIISAFKEALKEVKVEMDSDEMGRFVERTVADAIYT
jgi:TP901 family phage tail tape measure protein